MDYILKKYCPRIEFDSYEDFYENFQINVPDDFNFGYDVVDEWARVEPEKRALLWCDDAGEERTFTFTDISRLSNKAANAFRKLGIGKGGIVMCILRRRWEWRKVGSYCDEPARKRLRGAEICCTVIFVRAKRSETLHERAEVVATSSCGHFFVR